MGIQLALQSEHPHGLSDGATNGRTALKLTSSFFSLVVGVKQPSQLQTNEVIDEESANFDP
jgi:hypothetical protein